MTEQPRRRRPYAPRVPPEQRREQLLDATLRIITTKGYGDVTIEAVAREAGVTKPVVYGMYDGLPALLDALLDRQTGRALLQLFAALPLDQPDIAPEEFVERSIRGWIHVATTDPETWTSILVRQQDIPAVVWERIESGREMVREQVVQIIVHQFELVPGVDPDILSHALMAMGEYFGRLLMTHPERIDEDKLVSSTMALLTGIQVRNS
jgi:AcrR family transcriptional regulator